MKLTLQIKLLPTQEQFTSLKNTLIEANTACNAISDTAWNKKLFNQFKLHRDVYHPIKSSFNLSAMPEGESLMYCKIPHLISKAHPSLVVG